MLKTIRKILLMDKHQCPPCFYPTLDAGFRKFIHNPEKLFKPYLKQGQTAADIGCGPGFFSIGLARIVGEGSKITACDIQDSALDRLKSKIVNTQLEKIISVQKTTNQTIGLKGKFDFILNFWMLHEVDYKENFITEIRAAMKPGSFYMLVEPRFHVSGKAFKKEVEIAIKAGLQPFESPGIWMSRSVVFKVEE